VSVATLGKPLQQQIPLVIDDEDMGGAKVPPFAQSFATSNGADLFIPTVDRIDQRVSRRCWHVLSFPLPDLSAEGRQPSAGKFFRTTGQMYK
jgi:hypothetical protein